MKEVAAQYGSVWIAVVVGCGILFCIFYLPFQNSTGVANALGEWLKSESGRSLSEAAKDAAFDRYCSKGIEIIYTGQEIIAGKKIEVSRCFTALGGDGSAVPVSVCAVIDLQGDRYAIQQQGGKEYLYLEQEGIYRIVLEATDAKQRTVNALITFPVQAG